MGAVGPTNFLTDVNGEIRVHGKTTGAVGALDTPDSTFWAPVVKDPVNDLISDPRVRFDRLTDRWFMSVLDIPANVAVNAPPTPPPLTHHPPLPPPPPSKPF